MQKDGQKIWRAILLGIKSQVSLSTFKTWFEGSYALDFRQIPNKKLLVVGIKNNFIKEQIETKYMQVISTVLEDKGLRDIEVEFRVSQSLPKTDKSAPLFSGMPQNFIANTKKSGALNAGLSFENFVVGFSNNLAHLAASQVAGNLGRLYNPLLIYGPTGVGKTHLLHAIGNEVKSITVDLKTLYVAAEKFTNDYIESLRNKTQQLFRQKYRLVDLLLVDDVQFFAGKESTQDEFFNCFNELTLSGKQVVIVCDRHPRELGRLKERLASRFLGGMVADIGLPDLEMKIAILKEKCQARRVNLDNDLITLIASESQGGARELEGILASTIAQIKISNGRLKWDQIKTFVAKNSYGKKPEPTPNELVGAVCAYFKLESSFLKSQSRKASLVLARQVLMYLLRKELGLPLETVGKMLGGRDHSTVIHGVEKIENKVTSDFSFRDEILRIKSLIHN
ncbi:chromosomal replication initiator protein DnaA [Candidatus Curtissbacteria bacterium RIFCSPLOWO2_01_FULL_38_11b]|uniref:Chromosomal replication initiator protein DnaA n=1 Tax=Candidatus Curtissbacteria bacterium RIFCSPLOWO2_01_FULL_38_11b TaxID=1797725 RepID=A0A1F5H295_9BACT|nr:MAG: chromosomal replication initiator protein DnaA [Candidatus Curtissbacteria bacterium RIFCSPLOWO2_01_FULL_38_11b]